MVIKMGTPISLMDLFVENKQIYSLAAELTLADWRIFIYAPLNLTIIGSNNGLSPII